MVCFTTKNTTRLLRFANVKLIAPRRERERERILWKMKCLPSACEAFCKYFLIIVWQFALNLHKGKLKEMRQNLGNSFVLRVFRQRSCAWCPAMYGIYIFHLPYSLNVAWSPWLALPYVDCFFVYDSNLMVYNFIRVPPSQPPSPSHSLECIYSGCFCFYFSFWLLVVVAVAAFDLFQ